MPLLESLIAQIAVHKQRLDEFKAQSPEIAEALALSSEYHMLMNTLREICSTPPAQVVPLPNGATRPFWAEAAIYGETCYSPIRLVK